MRPTRAAALLLPLAPLLTPSQPCPQEEPSPEAILDRLWAHLGEGAQRERGVTLVLEGAAWFEGSEERGTFREVLAGPTRAHVASDVPGFGEFTQGVAEGTVWEHHPMFGGPKVKTGVAASTDLRRYALLRHAPWRASYATASLVGFEELDGRRHWVLDLTPKALDLEVGPGGDVRLVELAYAHELEADRWYVDGETVLPRRIDVTVTNTAGSPMRLTTVLSDWREVDGIRYPHRREMTAMGFTWIQEYDSIRHTEELPSELLELPDAVREVLAAGGADEPGTPPIRIETVEARHTASIRITCAKDEIAGRMGIAFPEIVVHLGSIGARMTGPPYARYYSFTPERTEMEVGIPVAEPIEPAGRIVAAELPGGRVLAAWHLGPYDTLGETHERAIAWLAQNELEPAGAPWEIYWTDPGMEPDPEKWRTQILIPLADR